MNFFAGRWRLKAASASILLAASLCTPALAADSDFWHRDTMTGDWGGARKSMRDAGLDLSATDIGEIQTILSGGFRQGTSFVNRFDLSADADLEKLFGWKGGSAHFTIYAIGYAHAMPAASFVGSVADPSNIEALPSTRLFTAWIEQHFLDDSLSIRIGQIAADDEFFTSDTAGGLISSTFGFATLLAANQNQGGPVYPLATPGIRAQFQATDDISIMGAVFGGAPGGGACATNPQTCNRYGLKFPTDGGSLWMGELQYAPNQKEGATGLPGTYKFGGWYATTKFADRHFGVNGLGGRVSLANPTAVDSIFHQGNWGIYGIADQMVWRSMDGPQSVSLFLRGGVSPSDRNMVSSYVDGGIGVKGLIPGREDDVLTLGVSYTKISSDAAALDVDTRVFTAGFYPVRNSEMTYELDYALQIAPWWTLQADLQYVGKPGGGVLDPGNPARSTRNAFIWGVRSTINF